MTTWTWLFAPPGTLRDCEQSLEEILVFILQITRQIQECFTACVMFLHMFICPPGCSAIPTFWNRDPPGNRHLPCYRHAHPLGTDSPLGTDTPSWKMGSDIISPGRNMGPDIKWHHTSRNHRSRQYASYWNAFLFPVCLSKKSLRSCRETKSGSGVEANPRLILRQKLLFILAWRLLTLSMPTDVHFQVVQSTQPERGTHKFYYHAPN